MPSMIDPNVLTFDALPAIGKLQLAQGVPVTATGTGTATSGFSGVAALLAKATVDVVAGAPTVTVKVQHSPDGTTWADLISFDAATADGVQIDRGETPDDYVRASWTVSGSGSALVTVEVAPVAAAGGGGSQPLSVLRSGIFNAADYTVDFSVFSGDIPAGTVVIKAWALITSSLDWPGGTRKLELVHRPVLSPSDGTDLAVYDITNGFPNGGTSTQFSEFMPLVGPSADLTLTNVARANCIPDGASELNVHFDGTFTAGQYEIFALILAAT